MTHECECDCSDVLAEVYLLLDHECPQAHAEELRKHLDACSECLEEYGISEGIKQLLARKCGGDQAPDQLKERLLSTIRGAECGGGRDVVAAGDVVVEAEHD